MKKSSSVFFLACLLLLVFPVKAYAFEGNPKNISSEYENVKGLISKQAHSLLTSSKINEFYEYFMKKSNWRPGNAFPYQNSGKQVYEISDGTYSFDVGSSKGCLAYSKFVIGVIYGNTGTESAPAEKDHSGNNTAEGLKALIMRQAQFGEHIRVYNTHSITFLAGDDIGFYALEFWENQGIKFVYYSYEGLAKSAGSTNVCILNADTIDNTALISLVDLNNGQELSGNVSISAIGRADDNDQYVIFYIDGEPLSSRIVKNSEELFSVDVDTSNFRNGSHTLSVQYVSKNGTATDSRNVIFNNSAGVKFVEINDSDTMSGRLELQAIRYDTDINYEANVYLDGDVAIRHIKSDAKGYFHFYLDTCDYENGSHTLKIEYMNSKATASCTRTIKINNSLSFSDLENGDRLFGESYVQLTSKGYYNDIYIYIDDTFYKTVSRDPDGNYIFSIDTSRFSEGTHKVSAMVYIKSDRKEVASSRLTFVHTDITDQGTCGAGVNWKLEKVDYNYFILNITGSGPMYDYEAWSSPWFDLDGVSIYKVNISPGVTHIGANAFLGEFFLEEVTIPGTVKSIGQSAFEDCNLQIITMKEGVETIGDRSFLGATAQKNNDCGFSMPNSVKTIGKNAFETCWFERGISLSCNLETIDEYAFHECYGLGNNLILPDSVKFIGHHAFYEARGIESLVFPSKLESFGRGAFAYTSVKEITFNEGLKSISYGGFSHCSSLEGISIPSSVNEIDAYAFSECKNIKNVTIKGVPQIEICAFESIGKQERADLYLYEDIPFNSEKWYSGYFNAHITSVSILHNTTVIKVGQTETLTARIIPSKATDPSVTWKSSDASVATVNADGCVTGIGVGNAKITVTTNDGGYSASCNVTIKPGDVSKDSGVEQRSDIEKNGSKKQENVNATQEIKHNVNETIKDETSLASYKILSVNDNVGTIQYIGSTLKSASSVTIPASVNIDGKEFIVTEIGANAFKGNKLLKKLVIGANVANIGKNAFSGCKNLKTIKINTMSLTKDSVGKNAFKGISNKAKIRVPKKMLKTYKKILKAKGVNGKKQKISK